MKKQKSIFRGTVLEEVKKILATKKFNCDFLDNEEFGRFEVVGKVNDLEKAFLALIKIKENKKEDMLNLGCLCPKEEVEALDDRIEALKNIVWGIIKYRIGIFDHTLGIREGGKIIKLPPVPQR
jgi:uncharacterized metal-binding protein